MKRTLLFFSILMITLFGLNQTASAQARYFYKVDQSEFPTVKMEVLGKARLGTDLDITPELFKVSEGETDLSGTITIDSETRAHGLEASIAILIDLRISVTEENKWTDINTAVKRFIDSVDFVGDTKVAVYGYVNSNWKIHDFSNDPESIKTELDKVNPKSGAGDVFGGFTKGENLFDVFANNTSADIPRHLIFISYKEADRTFKDSDMLDMSASAQANKIMVHSIYYKGEVEDNMMEFSKNTGGFQFTCSNPTFLQQNLEKIEKNIENASYSEVTWVANYGCDEDSKNRNITIEWLNNAGTEVLSTDDKNYVAPDNSVAEFILDEPYYVYGDPAGEHTSKEITLSVNNVKATVNALTIGNPDYFRVDDWGGAQPPFELEPGTTRTITIEYTQTPPTESGIVEVTIDADFPCDVPVIELMHNCGGQVAEDFTFTDVIMNQSEKQTITCAYENTSAFDMMVNVELVDANGVYQIVSGGGDNSLAAGECLDVEVEFAPNAMGMFEAKLVFTADEACGGASEMTITGKGLNDGSVWDTKDGRYALEILQNPTQSELSFNLELPEAKDAQITVYDAMGNEVMNLANGLLKSGRYDFNVNSLQSGVYYIRLSCAGFVGTEKFVVTK